MTMNADALDRPAATAVGRPGIECRPATDIERSTAAVAGYRAVFGGLADEVERNWHGALLGVDPERLHDLRVALRRTRSVLAAAGGVLPGAERHRFRDEFRWLARRTSAPRDLDVALLDWDANLAALPPDAADALGPARAVLQARCVASHAELAAALRSERAWRTMREWRAFLAEGRAPDPARRAVSPVGHVVARRIRTRHRRLVAHGRAVRDDSPAERLHEVRKDAKNLRYLVECFVGLLPERDDTRFVDALKDLQRNLGEHQDAAVHADQIRSLATALDRRERPATLIALAQLAEIVDDRRARARAEFAERFADFDAGRTRRALRRLLADIEP